MAKNRTVRDYPGSPGIYWLEPARDEAVFPDVQGATDEVALTVFPFVISFDMVHYSGANQVDWDVELQFARMGDINFNSPILELGRNTKLDVTNWFYRDLQTNATDGEFHAFPAGGLTREREYRRGLDGAVARVYHLFETSSDLSVLEYGENILVRARQHNGVQWGSWYSWVITVGQAARNE